MKNENVFLFFLFQGKYDDVGISDEGFILACSEIRKCEEHGYHLEQDAEVLPSDRIC